MAERRTNHEELTAAARHALVALESIIDALAAASYGMKNQDTAALTLDLCRSGERAGAALRAVLDLPPRGA